MCVSDTVRGRVPCATAPLLAGDLMLLRSTGPEEMLYCFCRGRWTLPGAGRIRLFFRLRQSVSSSTVYVMVED